jgi:hypothetical protein
MDNRLTLVVIHLLYEAHQFMCELLSESRRIICSKVLPAKTSALKMLEANYIHNKTE